MLMQADPERALALDYAPPDRRAALHALFALDETLGQVPRTTTEPIIGQMRLAWWHDALRRLDDAPPPAQPVLLGLAEHVLPLGVTGETLANFVTGWEVLIEAEAIDTAVMIEHAEDRGARLFAAAADMLGRNYIRVVAAGRGWALADLARHLRSPLSAAEAQAMAKNALSEALAGRWPTALRPLGALAHVARMDAEVPLNAPIPKGAPKRVARMMFHRVTGR